MSGRAWLTLLVAAVLVVLILLVTFGRAESQETEEDRIMRRMLAGGIWCAPAPMMAKALDKYLGERMVGGDAFRSLYASEDTFSMAYRQPNGHWCRKIYGIKGEAT